MLPRRRQTAGFCKAESCFILIPVPLPDHIRHLPAANLAGHCEIGKAATLGLFVVIRQASCRLEDFLKKTGERDAATSRIRRHAAPAFCLTHS
jgi:hypothetical protein